MIENDKAKPDTSAEVKRQDALVVGPAVTIVGMFVRCKMRPLP